RTARRASGAGRRRVVARLDDERLGRRRPAPLPRGVAVPARSRRGACRAAWSGGGRRTGAAVRAARSRDRPAARDTADRLVRIGVGIERAERWAGSVAGEAGDARRKTAAPPTPPGIRLHLSDGSTLETERLLIATGRRPNVERLGLDELGVKISGRGVEVDERLRAADDVWAIGDVTGIAQFT